MKTPLRVVPVVLLLLATPALGAWEELRRNDSVRLSIDPQSIRARGDEVSFRYLVDYREMQGDVKTAIYRSLVTRAAIRCKARTLAIRSSEGYAANEAQGPLVGTLKPMKDEAGFKKVEAGTSDEDLWQRVCVKKNAAPAKK